MTHKDYVICIPSYKRANFCNEKTLATLHKHKIDPKKIYVYVANKEDYDLYKATENMLVNYKNIETCFELFESQKVLMPLMIYENYHSYIKQNK